ncbi:hypothetical protein ACHAXS_003303 [Conticribra weissflogii]
MTTIFPQPESNDTLTASPSNEEVTHSDQFQCELPSTTSLNHHDILTPDPADAATNTTTNSPTPPPLKSWSLTILIFYTVSGGPFGIEPAILSAGNFYSLLGFVFLPLVWSVPEALVTAELGSAFNSASGGVLWVEEAFGEGWGFLCGFMSWASGATDNAIYPVLFLEYVGSVMGYKQHNGGQEDESGDVVEFLTKWQRFFFVSLISISLALVNYRGLDIVGHTSLLVCILSMSPFIIMTIVGASKVVPSRWLQTPNNLFHTGGDNGNNDANNSNSDSDDAAKTSPFDDDFYTAPGPLPPITLGKIFWRPFLNNMFWNLNSFDSAASFAPECSNRATSYPRGIFLGLLMTVLCYLLPFLVATGATTSTQSDWQDGHLGAIAMEIGGPLLGGWTIFASGVSNLGQFLAEMSSDAYLLMGMAEEGYLPPLLARRSKYGTPAYGILVGTVVVISFGWADFGMLIELLNANYAVSLLLEYGAFVWLRMYRKDMERPYRVPIPDWAAVLLVLPPMVGILIIFLVSSWYVFGFVCGAMVLGMLVWMQKRRSYKCGQGSVGSSLRCLSRSESGGVVNGDMADVALLPESGIS